MPDGAIEEAAQISGPCRSLVLGDVSLVSSQLLLSSIKGPLSGSSIKTGESDN